MKEVGEKGRGRAILEEIKKTSIISLLPRQRTSPSRRAPRWPEQAASRAGPAGRSGRNRRTRGRGRARSWLRHRRKPSRRVFFFLVSRRERNKEREFQLGLRHLTTKPVKKTKHSTFACFFFLASSFSFTQRALSQRRRRPHSRTRDTEKAKEATDRELGETKRGGEKNLAEPHLAVSLSRLFRIQE